MLTLGHLGRKSAHAWLPIESKAICVRPLGHRADHISGMSALKAWCWNGNVFREAEKLDTSEDLGMGPWGPELKRRHPQQCKIISSHEQQL